jgi:hypothetical protein
VSPHSAHEKSAKESVATNKTVRARREAKERGCRAIDFSDRGVGLLKVAFCTNVPLHFCDVVSTPQFTIVF